MKVKLVKYDPEWKSSFEIEKKTLIHVLDSKKVKIEHIGSTSIPEIWAKPIIDIMISVKKRKTVK